MSRLLVVAIVAGWRQEIVTYWGMSAMVVRTVNFSAALTNLLVAP